jgi:hypothetical protein
LIEYKKQKAWLEMILFSLKQTLTATFYGKKIIMASLSGTNIVVTGYRVQN